MTNLFLLNFLRCQNCDVPFQEHVQNQALRGLFESYTTKMEVVYLFVCRFVCLFYFTNFFDTPWDSWDCVLRSQTTCSICSSFFEFLWASNSPIVRSIVENEWYEGLTFQCHAVKEDICGPYHVQSIRFYCCIL